MAELTVKIDPADVAERALDAITYKGKTIREWADLLTNPKTRGDEIRVMSDEELAEKFSQQSWWNCPPSEKACPGLPGCKACWLDWLKGEIEEQ